ncbi:Uncharacterised protein [Legionella busanensis]|uniref:IcmD (DotP) n=1 Tax=Legionella busanensis TaxID=190655 RepID=A0A378KA27_9GAMM|nr:hypothetical protein [Legionella busanensis]STX81567.1 Uncharacterised protein [Legionella busanensis]
MKKIGAKSIAGGIITVASSLLTASVQAADWFPTALVGKNTTNKEAMVVFSDLLVKGFKILLFVVCIVSFYQFVMTVSHGIEAAKKSEGGLMAVFSSYAVMSFIYLSISIVCAYFGFTAVTNFNL